MQYLSWLDCVLFVLDKQQGSLSTSLVKGRYSTLDAISTVSVSSILDMFCSFVEWTGTRSSI